MRPFFPSVPNQIQPQGGNDPNLQQGRMIPPPPVGLNPQYPALPMGNFSNPNAHLSNLGGTNIGMLNHQQSMPPVFPNNANYPSMAQSNQLAAQNLNLAMALQLLGQIPNLQQSLPLFPGQLQNLNLLASLQAGGQFLGNNLAQNMNQYPVMPNGQMGMNNSMISHGMHHPASVPNIRPSNHCASNSGYGGKPHMAVSNPGVNFSGKTTGDVNNHAMGQSANNEGHIGAKKLQSPFPGSLSRNQQNGGNMANHVEGHAGGISNVVSENSFSKNFRRNQNVDGKRGNSHMRHISRNQFHHEKSMKQNFRPFTKMGGRGQVMPFAKTHGRECDNWREGKSNSSNSASPASRECVRRAPILYDENEIKKWREARRKNFPTSANVEKKLTRNGTNGENADEDTKLRRQQLKEVLSKQAELGVEVAEIPPDYLSEPENQLHGKGNEGKTLFRTDRPPNRYNNKRGRRGKGDFRDKRPRLRDDASTAPAAPKIKEPTLLEKLLSADIRRDRFRLLQVFRFMHLNSFFDHQTEKPLEYPSILMKQTGLEATNPIESAKGVHIADIKASKNDLADEIDEPKGSSIIDEAENRSSKDDCDSASEAEVDFQIMGKEENVGEQFEKPEEGEVTE
ncbi:uncharacterized protein [Typha latifolia]|uniref:uncharacterized protein isoform X1 n=1 Tax=Typha latifolia TaxID=4733 RepID=UPI003C2F3D88